MAKSIVFVGKKAVSIGGHLWRSTGDTKTTSIDRRKDAYGNPEKRSPYRLPGGYVHSHYRIARVGGCQPVPVLIVSRLRNANSAVPISAGNDPVNR